MNAFGVSAAAIDRLGWVLVHSLWEFLLIGFAAVALSRMLRRSSAEARYVLFLVSFSAMVVAPVATWLICPQPAAVENRKAAAVLNLAGNTQSLSHETANGLICWSTPPAAEPNAADPISIGNKQSPAVLWLAIQQVVRPWLNSIVAVWCCGVLAFAFRPLAGWHTVRRLRRVGASAVPNSVDELMGRTARRLNLRRSIEVLQSTLVQVPLVVGYLRPAILLPVSIVTNLPALQLEAILAHELAHICRHDYLVNLAQTLFKTVFFYHPAVWWLSHQIRNERENCCDDLAVALLGSRVEYGHALLSVEELRGTMSVLAVGAAGGSLVARIRRLLTVEPTRRNSSFSWSAGVAISSLALAIGVAATLSVTAQVKPVARDAASNANEPKSTGVAAGTQRRGNAAGEPDEKVRSLDIVIAQHVLLWDDQIVTWDEIADGLRAIRKQQGKPIFPRFRLTRGAIQHQRWQEYQAAAVKIFEEVSGTGGENSGLTVYRALDRYDVVKTAADLVPNPEDMRTGIVRNAAGRPVADATVVLMAESGWWPIAVMLRADLSLRDPQDEAWTITDKEGRFRMTCPSTGYRLGVLSSEGFALASISKGSEPTEIKLSPLTEIQVRSSDYQPQELNFEIELPELPYPAPGFVLSGISTRDQSTIVRLPAGKVVVRSAVNVGRWTRLEFDEEQFELLPGEKKSFVKAAVGSEVAYKTNGTPRRMAVDWHPLSVEAEKAARSLYKPTNVEFSEFALADGLQFLAEFHGIPIRVDKDTLQAAKISLDDIPVTLRLDGVALHWVLKELLTPAKLGYYVDADELVVTTQEKAAEQSKPGHAPNRPNAEKKDDTASPDKSNGQGAADEKPRSLNIVIAEHVLMWDGNIVTWEEVVEGLRAIRKQQGKPLHPSFKFTNGAIKAGRWDLYQAAAYDVYKELFEPAGMSIGSMSPRAGERYGKIRVPADLIPKPEDVRTGIVRNAAGRPVTVATVLLMPEDSVIPVVLRPNLSLRDTLDEVWVRTDNEGRFKIACPDTGYRLIVLSPAGFAQAPVPKAGEQAEIQLLPNCELQVSSADKSPQELGVSVHLPGMKEGHDGFSLYEISIQEQPRTIRLPPGRVTVSRSEEIGNGRKQLTPAETFDLKPGEKKVVSFDSPAAA